MTESLAEIIRNARLRKRLSQGALGAAVGYSASWVSRVEGGKLRPDDEALKELSAVLDVPWAALGLEGDDMRRREMLALGLGAGLSVVVPAAPAAAAAAEEGSAALERALFYPPEVGRVGRDALVTGLGQARALFHGAAYAELGRALPKLISGATASRAHDVAARAYVLLAQLAIKNYQGYSWVAADRARGEAALSGSPVVMGEAAHCLAITMRRSGEYQASIDQLVAAAERLGSAPDEVAMRGTLLLTASYSAAQAGWRGRAMEFIGQAEELASQKETAERKLYIPGVFGVDQTRVFRISVHQALDEGETALAYASKVDLRRLPNPERRGRMCMDVARVWRDLGEPERAFHALRALAAHAPQEARRPKVQAISSELLTMNGEIPGLRRFVEKTSAKALA